MGIIFSFWSVSSHLKTLLIYLSEEKSLLVMWSSPNSSKNVKTMGEITFAAKGAPRSLPQSESILLEGVPVPIGNLLSQYLKQESQTELWGFYKFTKKCEESRMNHTKFVY